MSLFPKVRRLLSHAAEDWAEVARELFSAPSPPSGPRPLRVMRLERRRVLSADFSLVGGGLVLDGFDAEDASLEISQQGNEYRFTTDEGWETLDGPLPQGVAVEGETLSIDRALLESLPNGLSVVGEDSASLNVMLGNADFSGLNGPVSLIAPSSLDQQPLALFTAPSEGLQLAVAPSGLTVSSLTVSGNLEVFAFGEITDGPNTQILVSGDAKFTTRTGGDAITAGITLADNPGDRFEVGGSVTFDAIEGASRYGINIGAGGWTEFGGVTALGGEVTIVEDAATRLDQIDATDFTLTTAGVIDTASGATIDVSDDASITSTGSRYRADFNGDRAVTAADYAAWAAGYEATNADRSDGDANGDGQVNTADYTIWRDSLGAVDLGGGINVSMVNRFEVGDEATLIAQDGSDLYDITADNQNANRFGSLAVVGSTVLVGENVGGSLSGTLLRGVVAESIELNSRGPITDAADAAILVAGNATISAVGGAITLADTNDPANRFEVGGLASLATSVGFDVSVGVDPTTGDPTGSNVTLGQVALNTPMASARLATDSDTLFTGVDAGSLEVHSAGRILDTADSTIAVTNDAGFYGAQGITLADAPSSANSLVVGGNARFEVGAGQDIDVGVNPADGTSADAIAQLGSLTFVAPGGDVRIALDGSALLESSSESGTLAIAATRVEDNAGANLRVEGAATLSGRVIDLGDEAGNETAFGTLAVDGSIVAIQEDSPIGDASPGTLLTSVAAGSLTLTTDGPINNASGAVITVAGLAAFDAGANDITLDSPSINFGSLSLVGRDIAVEEASDTRLVAVQSNSLVLASEGEITDTSDAVIEVTDDLDMRAVDGILLARGTTQNRLVVGGHAYFEAQDISVGWQPGRNVEPVGSEATVQFGSLQFTTTATTPSQFAFVQIAEDDAMHLFGTSRTSSDSSVFLSSGDRISDDVAAALIVDGTARLSAINGIVLADAEESTNRIEVSELATFAVENGGIDLGVDPTATAATATPAAATALFGSLQVNDNGTATRVAEDDTTLLARNSRVGELQITSAGEILDVSQGPEVADVEVAGEASLLAASGITLADGTATNNRFLVGGFGRFAVGAGQNIDLGVNADGTPADAIFSAGSLSFDAVGGRVRIAEDSGTVLGGASSAQALSLGSIGDITDQAGADTEVTQFAELTANGGASDVVLGDESARFSLGTPQLFNAAEYLAIAAHNVSVQADSGVNVRTSAADPGFRGTYFLAARGNISQVGGADGSIRPLTADRVSLDGTGAVLFSGVSLTSDDGELPNLQIKAGEAVDLEAEIEAVAALASRFDSGVIPSSDETELSPATVEADLADGTRPDQPLRQDRNGRLDAGLEDVLFAARFSRIAERTPDAIDIGDGYSAVVRVVGDATVGDVQDATGAAVDGETARGLVVTTTGNAYLDTTGSLEFTGEGRFDQSADVEAVALSGGVLTAVAGTVLKIDTEDADQPAAVARTTKLRSATGTVTSLSNQSGEDTTPGPRLLLDPSTEAAAAATTGLVRADTDFEQRLTVAVGSRGEDNLLVEVEWADVAQAREQSDARPSVRAGFDSADVPGSNELPDLIQTPVELIEPLDASTAATGLEYQELDGEHRVVTIRHNYRSEFVPNNPAQDTLPTTVRVFNDPAINLFDQGGARDLNSASFTIAPRIITLPPAGFFLLSEPDLPAEYDTPNPTLVRNQPTPDDDQNSDDEGRASVVTSAESVEFGRIDASGEWLEGIPGESWPQVRDDAEGDFLREIREKIDEGPYSEGQYRIQIRTPRGEQILEQWTKSDLEAEEGEAGFVAEPEAPVPDVVVPEAATPDAGAERVPAAAPAEELLPIRGGASNATEAAFAAIAAVGVWRKRLGDNGRLRLDSDGVGYTRASRRRRGKK